MDEMLKPLLENEILDEDTKNQIKEAFEKKLEEQKEQIREEFASRFEHDKSILVEAVDNMVTDHIRQELEEFSEDRKQLFKERAELSREKVKINEQHKKAMQSHSKVFENFIFNQVKKELVEFQTDKKELNEQKKVLASKLREERVALSNKMSERVSKLEEFVLKVVAEEIKEFATDKKSLIETRAKLLKEGKKKLEETQREFIKRASKLVENTIEQSLMTEMTEMKDDIRIARENNFGRKIFEAFGAEYMLSYLAEGSKVKEMQNSVTNKDKQLREAVGLLKVQKTLVEKLQTRTYMAEDKLERDSKLNELLSPLRGTKRTVMADMLSSVRTKKLDESFKRYLPAVLGGEKKSAKKQTLVESRTQANESVMEITGDKSNKLSDSIAMEQESENADIIQLDELRKYAGIQSE